VLLCTVLFCFDMKYVSAVLCCDALTIVVLVCLLECALLCDVMCLYHWLCRFILLPCGVM
jgi:hypothetical protein